MGEIVNLRAVKKRRARETDAARAAENRVRFGRTKVEKQQDCMAAERQDAVLDSAKLESPRSDR